jgi:hypothetical protein
VYHSDLAFQCLDHVSGTDLGTIACQPIPASRSLQPLRQSCRLKVPERLRQTVRRYLLTLGSLLARGRSAVAMLRKVDHRL